MAQILVFVLLFAMLPTAALAEESGDVPEEITVNTTVPFPTEFVEGKSYKITLDIAPTLEEGATVPANCIVTLDLNGHTLTLGNSLYNSGTMTIEDSGSNGTIAMSGDSSGMAPCAIALGGTSALEINGGTFEGGIQTADAFAEPTVTITKGIFREYINMSGTMDISGGTFEKDILSGDLTISGGNFNGAVEVIGGSTATITGGSFKTLSSAWMDSVAPGHVVVLGTDERYSVQLSPALPTESPEISVGFDEQGVASVTLTAGEGLDIFYSTTSPYTSFQKYSNPVAVSDGGKIYAYVVGDSGVLSELVSQTIEAPVVAAPKASPDPGIYNGSVQVTLTADDDAEIYYTTNGETPSLTATPGTTIYTGPFTLTASTTVKVVAFQNGRYSDVATYQYTITSSSSGGNSGGSSGDSGYDDSDRDTTTETSRNPDGSTTTTVTDKRTGTVTETTREKDGTKTVVETKKNGDVTTTVTQKDGTTSTTTVVRNEPIRAEVKFSPKAASSMNTLVAPVQVDTRNSVVTVSGIDKSVKVSIPVEGLRPGTVAVIDGEIVKTAVPENGNLLVPMTESNTITIMDNSKDFTDMPSGHWAADAVTFVTSRELFHGTSAETFTPNAPMTRQMLMTVLARLDGADIDASPYAQGMAWAQEKGISDGRNPTGNISREQLAVMLYRFAGSPVAPNLLLDFTDAGQVSSYADSAMRWAVEQGVLSGKGNGILDPQGQATRAQVATMLQRFISNVDA